MEQEEWVRQEGRGCGGALGETGGALTRSCLLWSEAAACCELECVLARGLRDSLLAGGGGEAWPRVGCLSLFLKAQRNYGRPALPVSLVPLRSKPPICPEVTAKGSGQIQGRSSPCGPSCVPGVVCQGEQHGPRCLARPPSAPFPFSAPRPHSGLPNPRYLTNPPFTPLPPPAPRSKSLQEKNMGLPG